jgi:Flp pilus assembly protein TadB
MVLGTRSQDLQRAQSFLAGFRRSPKLLTAGQTDPVLSWSGRFGELLYFSGRDSNYLRLVSTRALFVFAALAIAAIVLNFPALLLLIFVWGGGEYILLTRRVFSRAQDFEKDYPALLLSLAAGVRSGLDPLSALCRSADLFIEGSSVREELLALRRHLDEGDTEEVALVKFAETIRHPDIDLFRAAFMLARKEGSSLGECLQRLVRVTRQRQSFRRRVRAAVAMQKLSAFGIGGCALAIGTIQGVTNPRAFQLAWESPFAFKALLFSLTLILLGIGLIVHMARARL